MPYKLTGFNDRRMLAAVRYGRGVAMGTRRRRGYLRIPEPDRFAFTSEEIETMRRRIHATLWVLSSRRYHNDPEAQELNDRAIRRKLWALHTGCITKFAPPLMLQRVYAAADAAMRNALVLGKTPEEARRSAVAYAQLYLEQALGMFR